MTSTELRQAFIDFFVSRGHKQIPSASLIPENDPSVLFTTAGMQPLVPYLLGAAHPAGTRLVDSQKCIRTGDIDDVGDSRHLTFFEMLGNWSLGDYFKDESIAMSHEFLTSVLKIPQNKIAVTVFAGDADAPRDMEAAGLWRSHGYGGDQIFFYPKSENWWAVGDTGPCGPDTEIFYIDESRPKCCADCGPACDCGRYTEIWNNVFMQYNRLADGSLVELPKKNIDTGMGLERIVAKLSGYETVFQTDLFAPILEKIAELTGKKYDGNTRAFRIVADHIRAATFILGDDAAVAPGNTDQGYILRRLIRRAYRYLRGLDAPAGASSQIAVAVIEKMGGVYPELARNREFILRQLDREEELFGRTLESGLRIANRFIADNALTPENVFKLYDTYGFPLEFTTELAAEHDIAVDADAFAKLFAAHQEKSRAGAEQKFKGGLADDSVETTRLHTAAHLLHGALRTVLGDTVFQRGSNITAERLRFDFSFDRKVAADELAAVEKIVNDAIAAAVPVSCREMTIANARASGAVGVFDDKYGDVVRVYDIPGYDIEICGGPHVENTSELGAFKIVKEEASSAGVRRIKAVVGK
jgi:alanyl-tRNA synthetase